MFGFSEALLGFIRRQIGLRTDAASATGSLHAKSTKIIDDVATVKAEVQLPAGYFILPSDTVQASSDDEVAASSSSFKVAKSFTVIQKGQYKYYVEIYTNGTQAYYSIQKNGVDLVPSTDIGYTHTSASPLVIERLDLLDVGDRIDILIKRGGNVSSVAYARNFRLKFTAQRFAIPSIITG